MGSNRNKENATGACSRAINYEVVDGEVTKCAFVGAALSAARNSPARWGRNKWYNTDIGSERRANTMELNGTKEGLLSI